MKDVGRSFRGLLKVDKQIGRAQPTDTVDQRLRTIQQQQRLQYTTTTKGIAGTDQRNNRSNEEARRTTIPDTGNVGVTTKSVYFAQATARDNWVILSNRKLV